MIRATVLLAAALAAGCAADPGGSRFAPASVPPLEMLCSAAQRHVTQTAQPVELVRHADFDAFVRSKAVIEGPTIQQYTWYGPDGQAVGASCKLKSADHLNLAFGAGTAGPDLACQDFHRALYRLVRQDLRNPAFDALVFDPVEAVTNDDDPNMTGPDWLAPFTALRVDLSGDLVLRTKGFRVDFTDPRFAAAPPRFRGVHYCHFVAPAYLRAVLEGTAPPRVEMGRAVDLTPAR